MVLLSSSTIIIAAIIGFVFFSENQFFCRRAGQAVHGLLSIVCFALVGIAFWRFGWTVGLLDLALVLFIGNIAFSFHAYLRNRAVRADAAIRRQLDRVKTR
jgi:hypothetical protein